MVGYVYLKDIPTVLTTISVFILSTLETKELAKIIGDFK